MKLLQTHSLDIDRSGEVLSGIKFISLNLQSLLLKLRKAFEESGEISVELKMEAD